MFILDFNNLFLKINKFVKNTRGITTIEYALVGAVTSVGILGSVTSVGETLSDTYVCISSRLQQSDFCPGQVIDTGFDALNITSTSGWDMYTNGEEIVDGWKSTGTGEIEIGNEGLYGLPKSPTNSTKVMELNGHSGGTLSKTLKTIPGIKYSISFNYGNRAGGAAQKEFSLNIGGQTTNYTTATTQTWDTKKITFTATSNQTNISFTGKNIPGANNGHGAVISGISLAYSK